MGAANLRRSIEALLPNLSALRSGACRPCTHVHAAAALAPGAASGSARHSPPAAAQGHWDYRKEWFFYGGGSGSWRKGWQAHCSGATIASLLFPADRGR